MSNSAVEAARIAKTWTLAYRNRRANHFKRVMDLALTWDEATRHPLSSTNDVEVWTVPTAEAENTLSHEEDRNNILTPRGRRVVVRDTGSRADLERLRDELEERRRTA